MSDVEGFTEEDPHISIHAVAWGSGYQTMRVKGYVGNKALNMLIDYGSTHNFLNLALAKRVGCRLEPMNSLSVTVADGYKLQCTHVQKF